MDSQKVDMYLMTNAKYFQGQHLNYIRERLMVLDESKWFMVQTIELKDPTTILIISIVAGSLGIDRFMIGDTGLGVAKLLTCGGLGIWALVDWFLIMDATRQKTWRSCNSFYNSMTRNRLYLLLFLALLAGYSYTAWALWSNANNDDFTPCLFKNITGIACPSCGTTRSVLLLANGNIQSAVMLNPLGIIVAAIMVISPLWLLYDVLLQKNTLYISYKKTEQTIRIQWVAVILTLLVLANWAWNIYKGL